MGELEALARVLAAQHGLRHGDERDHEPLEQRAHRRHRPGGRAEVGQVVRVGGELPRGAAHDGPQLRRRQPGLDRAAQRGDGVLDGAGERDVAAEDDPPGRHEREERQDVRRVPPRRVEEEVGEVVQAARQPAEVGDGRVGEDDARAGRVDRAGQRRAPEAVDPRPAVHEDGQAAPAGQREDVVQPGVVEREALAARVELEAHGPGVERGLGAAQRLVVRVQARERVQPPARVAGGGGERLVGLGVAAALAERDEPAARAGALQGVLGVLERGEQARRVARPTWMWASTRGRSGTRRRRSSSQGRRR
jgi:hypothetical protein